MRKIIKQVKTLVVICDTSLEMAVNYGTTTDEHRIKTMAECIELVNKLEEYETLLRDVVNMCEPICEEATVDIDRLQEMLND